MAIAPFRFVHASDFHLERTISGLAEAPDHLREVLTRAPYRAAARVFDTVLFVEADFLVLVGDLLDVQNAPPRAFIFLQEQFQRLADRNIPVFWAGGRVDSVDQWPIGIRWPQNVHYFSREHVESHLVRQHGLIAARILGWSYNEAENFPLEDFHSEKDGIPVIAIAHTRTSRARLARQDVDYWALGGQHKRSDTSTTERPVIHCPGTAQSTKPKESGTHGCTVVDFDDQRRVRLSFRGCDVLRWENQRIELADSDTRMELIQTLRQRVEALRSATPEADLLIRWTIGGGSRLLHALRRGVLAGEVLQQLRSQFGQLSPVTWSVSLEAELPEELPLRLFDQDTILGDFLRLVREYDEDETGDLGLEELVPQDLREQEFAATIRIEDIQRRKRLLREAGLLGVDLLSGEEN